MCKCQSCNDKCQDKYIDAKCIKTKCLKAKKVVVCDTLDLSKATVIPPKEDPLLGWWILTTLNDGDGNRKALLNFSKEGDNIILTRYSGSVGGKIREWTAPEVFNSSIDPGLPLNPVVEKVSDTEYRWQGIFSVTGVNGTPVVRNTFTIQANSRIASLAADQELVLFQSTYGAIYYKLDNDKVPEIIPTGYGVTDSLSTPLPPFTLGKNPNLNSPVEQFKEYLNMTRYMGNPQFNKNYNSSVYPGELADNALEEQALTTGFGSFQSDVSDIWSSIAPDAPFTTIFTEKFHNACVQVKVTISGLGSGSDTNSPFAVINGSYRVTLGFDITQVPRDLRDIYTDKHYDFDGLRYFFNVPVDTSSIRALNRFYNKDVDGAAQVLIEYGPVTENCPPGDWYSSMQRWMSQNIYQVHAYATGFTQLDGSPFDTFDELAQGVTDLNIGGEFLDTRFVDTTSGASFYTGLRSGIPLVNDLYNTSGNSYNVPINNYLEESFNMYWAIDPNTSSDAANITGNLVVNGYNANGSRFMFTYAPEGQAPIFPYPGAPQAANGTSWTLLTGSSPLIFGKVKNELEVESTVFIQIPDEFQNDGLLELIVRVDLFYPDGTQGYPNLKDSTGGGSVMTYMYSILMEKLMSYSPKKMILETRSNAGGFPEQLLALAVFVGADRFAPLITLSRRTDRGNTEIVTGTNQVANGIVGLDIDYAASNALFDKVRVSEVEEEITTNSFFRGLDMKFNILISPNSASVGDFCPWFFIGDDVTNPRDLGNGVTAKIIGSVDGRADGTSSAPIYATTNQDQNATYFGDPQPYLFDYQSETYGTTKREQYDTLINQQPVTEPDELLNGWYAETVWPDTGATTPHPDAPLAGWTPTGNVQEVSEIETLAAAGLNSTYFLISSPSTDYYVWYDVDAAGVDPLVPGRTGIQVALTGADSADQVAVSTLNALGSTGEFYLSFVSTDKMNVQNVTGGAVTITSDGASATGFTFVQVQSGADNVVGQPDPSDQSTWRDRWFEVALTV